MPTIKVKNKLGQEEPIVVEKLPITRRFEAIDLLIANKQPDLVAYFCKKPMAWLDDLTDESFDELSGQIAKVVFSQAMENSLRNPIAGLRLQPLLAQMDQAFFTMPPDVRKQLIETSISAPGTSSSTTPSAAATSGASSSAGPAPTGSATATPAAPPA